MGKAINGLTTAKNNAEALNDMVNHTSKLSENVSAKVRRLDESRVRNCFLICPNSPTNPSPFHRTACPSANNESTT